MPSPPPGGMQKEPDDYASVVTIEGNDERTGERITSSGKDSKWIVTENSTLSELENKGTIVDMNGNSVSIIDKAGNEITKGESIYHITID